MLAQGYSTTKQNSPLDHAGDTDEAIAQVLTTLQPRVEVFAAILEGCEDAHTSVHIPANRDDALCRYVSCVSMEDILH